MGISNINESHIMAIQPLVLFYDIDGCFHPHGRAKFNDERTVHRAPDDGLFEWAPLLQKILDEFPSIQLVCHSTWRNLYTFDDLKKQLPNILAERTIGITKPYRDRHLSIMEYAEAAGITNYVILDDDPWAFPSKLDRLVLVPSDTGISSEGALARLSAALAALKTPSPDSSFSC